LAKFGGGKLSESRVNQLVSPWFQYFVAHDPAVWLSKVRQPVLAINGSKDVQMEATPNLDAISAALKNADNKDFKVTMLEGMNHLFQNAKTGRMAEYAQIEETISPRALTIISNWIKERSSTR